ncbi:MAG: hypothetical protein ACOY45_02270 [Pseudomonadota bacterium]
MKSGAILAVLMLGVQEAPPETSDEIVVIARRVRSISATVGRDPQGRYHCALSTTTGRPSLDDRLCRAATDCTRRNPRDAAAVNRCIEQRKAGLMRRVRRELEARP